MLIAVQTSDLARGKRSTRSCTMRLFTVPSACRGLQDFPHIHPRDSVGRFIRISSVTSCRSSADEIGTVSHFPSG